MRKYEPLQQHLASAREHTVPLRFAEIERIIGDHLPPSAHEYDQWWANDSGRSGRQCHAWLEAGYRSESVDRLAGTVTFCRD